MKVYLSFCAGFILGVTTSEWFSFGSIVTPMYATAKIKDPVTENKTNHQLPTKNETKTRLQVNNEAKDKSQPKNHVHDFNRLFSKTDKTWRHGYQWFYGLHLAEFRGKENVAVLEIGGRRGDSAIAWSSYLGGENEQDDRKQVNVDVITYGGNNDAYKFDNPTINCKTNCSVHTFYVDQSDSEKLEGVINQRPAGWDIVIDDGSHVPFHNIISFETLWKNVRPGGIYVVEDIETSYYPDSVVYGYKFNAGILAPPPYNSLSRFRQYVDVINRAYIGPTGKKFSLFEGDDSIMEIGFARNVIFIRKVPEGKDYNDKSYGDYPHEMVKGKNFNKIETTLNEALKIFQNQTRVLPMRSKTVSSQDPADNAKDFINNVVQKIILRDTNRRKRA